MPWKPKPIRPVEPPTVKELEELRRYLVGEVRCGEPEDRAAGLLLRLCRASPADRFRSAMDQVIRMLHTESRRTNELSRILTEDELEAYNQVSRSRMKPDMKWTVERLLCVEDRHIMSSFLRNAFNNLRIHQNTKLRS